MKKSLCHPRQKIDKLSNLPDEVRNIIVSFLPMQEAMRTTILSRSWRFFSLTNMEFNQSKFDRMSPRKDFGDFVDHILEHHNGPSIQNFYITVNPGRNQISTRRINQWISFAVRHRVRKFSFEDLSRSLEKLPCFLFTCTTLTSLKLCKIILKSPFVFSCPSLKELDLERVHCHGDSGSFSLNCDCPVLESLLLWVTCSCDTLVIFAPGVKYVKLEGAFRTNRIILSFSNLLKIKYTGFTQPEFDSETLLSLSKAEFIILDPCNDTRATKFMMAFLNVESLSLYESYMELLSRDSLSPFPVAYRNLRELQVDLQPVMKDVLLLTSLLRCCPNLQSLEIASMGLDAPKNLLDIEGFSASEIHGESMLKHLKKVSYNIICGFEAELYLVSYLLQHANELEVLSITYTALHEENSKRIEKKLKSFTRASPRVNLDLFSVLEI